MNTNAMTWLSRQIAWEARLAELRRSDEIAERVQEMPVAA